MIKHLILLKTKNDGYQRGLVSMICKLFYKKTSATLANTFVDSGIKNKNIFKKKLAEDLQKPIIRKIESRKVNSPFIDNICGADLADMQLISKFNIGIPFLLCIIDIFSKYAWFILLKDKKKYYN